MTPVAAAATASLGEGQVVSARGLVRVHRRGAEVVHALDGVDLDLEAGEVCALVGPSGSGKSSLLTVLCGWEPLDAGTLHWAPGLGVAAAWGVLALVPQALGLLEELSVAENVGLPLRLAGVRDPARVEGMLERFGLSALGRRPPAQCSLGEQQRAAVARALVLRPRLLLCDEPTAHQDAANAEGLLLALREAAEAGACVVVATHAAEGRAAADRVISLRDGRVVDG